MPLSVDMLDTGIDVPEVVNLLLQGGALQDQVLADGGPGHPTPA